MTEEPADPSAAPPAPAKKLDLKIPLFVVLALVAAGGAYWAGRRAAPVVAAAATAGTEAPEPAGEGDGSEATDEEGDTTDEEAEATPTGEREDALVVFEPLVVNLADAGGGRFVRLTVQLVVPHLADAERLKKAAVPLVQARAAMLEILSQQTAEQLITPAGKVDVKKAIAERLAELIPDVQVVDVLFSDFVVQF